ncbi:MAG: DNRLRE domain-containing protein [Chitinivibrionales bacterium]|nr:DNRLRE domain-containing protein [Chitinivibrionales bacterium]
MLAFNLSNIAGLPSNANVTQAQLSLYFLSAYGAGAEAELCSLFVIAKPWNVNEVTWNRATASDPWSQTDPEVLYIGDSTKYPGGGDRLQPCAAVAAKSESDNSWEAYDITAVIRQYLKNSSSFHGLILKPYFSNIGRRYASSQYAQNDKRPKLTIRYSGTGIKTKDLSNERLTWYHISISNHEITVRLESDRIHTISFFSVKGMKLFSTNVAGKQTHRFSAARFGDGVYFLRISDGNTDAAECLIFSGGTSIKKL